MPTTLWTNRIVGADVKPASWFLANEKNFRIHPLFQQESLLAVLEKVGWIQDVIVNLRTSEQWHRNDRNIETLVDGHARVALALSHGEDTPVPVKYVDLTPDEENIMLALFDPISAWAATDPQQLEAVLRSIQESTDKINQALAALATENDIDFSVPGATPPSDPPKGGGSHDITCPYCQMTFTPEKP